MNTEHLLDAIGLLDDDLVREAEEYKSLRKGPGYWRWGSLAACCALVLALGYGALWLGTGGDYKKGLYWDGVSGGGNTAASAPASNDTQCGADDGSSGGAESMPPEPSAPAEPDYAGEQQGDRRPAIMVDGVLYFFTGEPVSVAPSPGEVKTVTSYTSGVPEMDGQSNFSQDLSAQYALVTTGGEQKLAVWMETEWILFDTLPPPAE